MYSKKFFYNFLSLMLIKKKCEIKNLLNQFIETKNKIQYNLN